MKILSLCIALLLAIPFVMYLLHPTVVVTPSTQPAFTLDVTRPFTIDLGRGSGWHGFDIVRITQSGLIQLHRGVDRKFASATLQLSTAQVVALVNEVNASELTSLEQSYVAPVADGTQWILWIEQSGPQKAVYFSNTFPTAIREFAKHLDASLAIAGSATLSWTRESEEEGRTTQMMLSKRLETRKR